MATTSPLPRETPRLVEERELAEAQGLDDL